MDIYKFRDDFNSYTYDWTWEVQGFIDDKNRVHPIDSDTKVISTVFERLSSPVIRSIAEKMGFRVEIANQTTYPDFTLTKIGYTGNILQRIAIDIKSTYHLPPRPLGFTLGSYKSFIRNQTKNILYPYNTYTDHWVIGFIYTRNPAFAEYNMENIPRVGDIKCPYKVESVFIRNKAEIVGLRAGSGNTANIGSIKLTDPNDFATTKGPFYQFTDMDGACDHYWCNYDEYRLHIRSASDLGRHPDFQVFK